jgi:CRP-like cAMP-binding protein
MNASPTIARSELTFLKTLLEGRYHGRGLQTFRKGETIPLHDHDIWLVYRGVVQLTTLHPNGDEAILGLISPLMPFGPPLSILQTYNAVTITETDVMRVPWSEVQNSPELMECLLGQTIRRLQQSEALIAIASHHRIEDRLLDFLQLLKRELSTPTPEGHRLTIRLTHQHFANAIGTTRVTVTRLLGELRDRHLLAFDSTRHILLP